MPRKQALKLLLAALFVAGAMTSCVADESRVKAAGAVLWVGIPTAMLWVDIGRWIWSKRVGPLLPLGIISKSESTLAYRGLVFLYIVMALIAGWITYGIAGYALIGVSSGWSDAVTVATSDLTGQSIGPPTAAAHLRR